MQLRRSRGDTNPAADFSSTTVESIRTEASARSCSFEREHREKVEEEFRSLAGEE